MEKTIKWDQNEAMTMQGIEQEKTQTLAQIGALMTDLEMARKNLDTINEKHKMVIRQALNSRGISQFEQARPIQGGVLLTVPDEKEARANGGL